MHDPEKPAENPDVGGNGNSASAKVVINPHVEKKVVKKFDIHLTPLVAALFLLSFLDRSNIGNARIAGMEDDLSLSSSDYEWLLTIFYIAYIVFQPLTLCWKIFPPSIWATITVFGWGLFSTVQASTVNWTGMMILRFFLGAVEAGYGPGVPYLLSFFYLRHELGLRIGMFFSAAPLANTFAGALAYGITSGQPDIPSWKLLFIVEGVPTLLMAPVAYFFIPNTPSQARYLSAEEKAVASARGVRQSGEAVRFGRVDWHEVGQTLLDPIAWLSALMYFSCNVSYSSLPVFLPTILRGMGFTSINSQGLTAPPYFLSFLITIITPWIADRTQQRGLMVIILSIIGGVGYVLLAASSVVGVRYFGVWLAAAGIFPAIANILPWTLNNQTSDSRRGAGIALLNLIGQCGPLLGTKLFPDSDSPGYVKGFSICAAFIFFNGLLALILRTLLVWKNKKLDEKYGTREGLKERTERGRTSSETEDGDEAVENFGPKFRYVL